MPRQYLAAVVAILGLFVNALHAVEQPSAAAVQRVGAALQKTMSLQFDRGDLNKAMEAISYQIDVPISFEGEDLQRDGITKHSNLIFHEAEQPAEQLLLKLLVKTDLERRLIYVIRPGADGRGAIVICTRSGAKRRNEPIPKNFEAQSNVAVTRPIIPSAAPPSLEAMQRVHAALRKNLPLRSDRGELRNALKVVSENVGVPISTESADFQRDGVTANANLRFDEPEQPADQLLRTILWKTDRADRLIYVIRPGADGRGTIVVCTRSGAKLRNEPVPTIFNTTPQH